MTQLTENSVKIDSQAKAAIQLVEKVLYQSGDSEQFQETRLMIKEPVNASPTKINMLTQINESELQSPGALGSINPATRLSPRE